jgi:GNAT superfamily N-acetyltransferase
MQEETAFFEGFGARTPGSGPARSCIWEVGSGKWDKAAEPNGLSVVDVRDVVVRWAMVDDAAGVAVVHVETWRAAYRGLIADDVLDRLNVDERAEWWGRWIAASLADNPTDGSSSPAHRLLVAELEGTIGGWASFGAGRDAGAGNLGELAGLYVRPDYWSRGVGHALIARVEAEFLASGWTEAFLWVLDGNDRAIRFYEQHGWSADGGEKFGAAGGAHDLHELRHVRRLA